MRITNHRKEFRGKPQNNAGLGMKQQLGYIGEERIGIAMPKKNRLLLLVRVVRKQVIKPNQ
jgi:hypothetical protein